MKTTKKIVAIVLSIIMLFGVIPLSVLAEEAQTVEKGVWVAGEYLGEGNYTENAFYWVNDGNGGITKEGATEKNYNVKWRNNTLTLKNANLSKLYEYKSQEATDYQGNTYALKEAAVIYSNLTSLNIELEGKTNIITAKVDDTETVRYKSVAGICSFYEEVVSSSGYYGTQYRYGGTLELREKGKLEINVSKGNNLYNSNEACKGIYFYNFNIRDNSKITVSDSDVAFYCGLTYSMGYGASAGSMYIYNGTIEAKCNYTVFNIAPNNKYIRDPKIVVSVDKNGETTGKYEESIGELRYNTTYKYVKVTPHSAFSAFFLNTFEDIGSYLVPQYVMFLLEVFMQFPLTFEALISWLIGLIIGGL